jgi:hypothetical protein
MKTVIAFIAFTVFVAFVCACLLWVDYPRPAPRPNPGRYAITPAGESPYAMWVIDTATGELWKVHDDGYNTSAHRTPWRESVETDKVIMRGQP